MMTRTEPAWMQPWMRECREELLALDPRYVVLFDLRWRLYAGDCTAADLHRQIHQRGYKWAPDNDATARRWLAEIKKIEATHRFKSATRSP